MKSSTIIIVVSLIGLSLSTAEAYKPDETFTDQNGDKRHFNNGKIYRRYTPIRDSKNQNTNSVKPCDIKQNESTKYGSVGEPSNNQCIKAEKHLSR